MKTLVNFINESLKSKNKKHLNLDKKTLMDIRNHKYNPKNKKFFNTLIKKAKIHENLSNDEFENLLDEYRYYVVSTIDKWSESWEDGDDMANDLDEADAWFADEGWEEWKEGMDLSGLSKSQALKLEEEADKIVEEEIKDTKMFWSDKFDDGRYSDLDY